jgi:predicted dehydrogenase
LVRPAQRASSRLASAGQSRRDLLKFTAAAGLAGMAGIGGFWVAGRGAWADEAKAAVDPKDKVKLGIIAVAGRAKSNLDEEGNAIANQEIVAICDVDEKNLGEAAKRFPGAKTYNDFRKLLERNDLDGVVISTADHCHAPATLIALSTGKHVYCEKPLAHTVEEVRRVSEAAKKYKRVTQMGTQIHAGSNYRRVVELVQSGAIGPVTEAHVVLGGARWHSGDLPAVEVPPPATLHYDLWVGPQPFRPYHKEYHPASWRSFWHWGTGTLGDMGCHYIDLPFWALKLRHPTKCRADGPPVHPVGCPEWVVASWDFPARDNLPPVKLHWYHGGKKPTGWADWGVPQTKNTGVVFIGSKGKLFADYGSHKLMPAEDFKEFKAPEKSIPESLGHHKEWLAAIRKNDPTATTCNFDYSGAVAETVLLGTVAYRSGKELEWDAAKLKATNAPQAEQFVRQSEYRKGWGMDILTTL